MFANKNFVDILTHSKIYRDYERAFIDATGMPVSLRPVESWQLPHRGKKSENPFCAMMAQRSGTCAACLRMQEELSQSARAGARTLTCFSGMSDTAVPVRLGENLIGLQISGRSLHLIMSGKPQARPRTLILIVDDHPMMREGLASLLNAQKDIEVCGEAETAAQALEMIPLKRPAIVIADITLPGKSGIELVKDIAAMFPDVATLAVSMHDEVV
jgi:PleD family two-component response regulator